MTDATSPTVLVAGEAAVIFEFGDRIDPLLVAQVQALDRAITAAAASGALPGIVETVPTFRSLAILLDPLVTSPSEVAGAVQLLQPEHRDASPANSASGSRQWCLPVLYGGTSGPDLDWLAAQAGLTPEAVIELHLGQTLSVYMLGFLPGFAFMGSIAKPLRRPRRTQPRTRVPAGTVAVAMDLSAVYPWESPGGWHLLGHTPVSLFDPAADSPTLLRPGDRVRFRSMDADEHKDLSAACAAGTVPGEHWLDEPA